MTHLLDSAVAGPVSAGWPHRVSLFGIELDAVGMSEAVAILVDWIRNARGPCRYVVTPNVDHVVILQEHAGLRAAYADASLVVADGWPIVAASRFLGRPLPERVAGSDLVPRLLDAVGGPFELRDRQSAGEDAQPDALLELERSLDEVPRPDPRAPLKVFLLGAAPGVALRAAERIEARWPAIEVVGCDSPPPGFERREDLNDAILARIAGAEPDLLIVGLGAPKQELWVHAHRARLRARVAICAGATIDFLAGHRRRAPIWMRRWGLEWLHRMLAEPRRLARRYLRDAAVFPRLVLREQLGSTRPQTTRDPPNPKRA
jgi:N-acetylglucosaminyldiphosphoundecaprenol N-acetyl-beta-D-mannosaminyltransferase